MKETFEDLLIRYKRIIEIKANSYHQPIDTVKDLEQVGRIVLYTIWESGAIDESNNPNSYILITIDGKMKNHLTQYGYTVRPPANHIHNPDKEVKTTISINTPINENQILEDTIGNEEDETRSFDLHRDVLKQYLSELIPEWQTILKMRFEDQKTFDEIAIEMGCTRQNINEKYNKAIRKLQKLFNVKLKDGGTKHPRKMIRNKEQYILRKERHGK